MVRERANMKVTQIYLTERQHEKINKISKIKGIGMSEVIRRLLDDWIDKDLNDVSTNKT